MCRTSILVLTLVAALATAGAALAHPATPASTNAPTQALPAWLADSTPAAAPGVPPLAIGVPEPTPMGALCSPPTNDYCPYANCICVRFTCAHCGGVKSFTCNEATQTSTCTCKTC
jgi:hypothetical protein